MNTILKQCGRFQREDYQAEIKAIIESACAEYDRAYSRVGELNEIQQDLLHIIESESMDSQQRSKWFTAMRDCRRERRECNVTVAYLQEFINFVRTPSNQGQINRLLVKSMLNYNDGIYNAHHITSDILFNEDELQT